MCGIAGRLHRSRERPVDRALVARMTATLRHRGPDDEGVWVDGPVGLGSRRLAVIDLSPRGRQPLTSEDGAIRLVFNGEVYNFQALRTELTARGHRFASDTDAETVVHLYEELGPECVVRLRGMFAFALWDARTETLLLARDRLGKKPLVYRDDGETLTFASEAKALLTDPALPATPDPAAIHRFLALGYVPGPDSAFRGVRRLPPAHRLVVRRGRTSLERYWSLAFLPKRTEPEAALAEELVHRLGEAVRLRLISDVPVGVLLSGGLDSSAVVALMRAATAGPIRTFSIGFDRPEYDELRFARAVARRFDTDHTEDVVKPAAAGLLERLAWHYDEPFADASALPSMVVCGLARRSVTVALNGDGGDECFAGYDRHVALRAASWHDRLPARLRAPARLAGHLGGGPKSIAGRLGRFARALSLPPLARYGRWVTLLDPLARSRLYTAEFHAAVQDVDPLGPLAEAWAATDSPAALDRVLHGEVRTYLADDLLVKMDIASMASSLEVRSPFLDHEVVEFAARLPVDLKLRGLRGKYLLRCAMQGRLPAPLLRRGKMGFALPIDHWFRGELGAAAREVLLDRRTRQRGYVTEAGVRTLLDDHEAGDAHHHAILWALLVLELWHRTWIDRPAGGPGPDPC